MSTLTYSDAHAARAEPAVTAPRRSLWRRFYDALVQTQQRRAEREIARFLANHGGLLTDDLEREIMQRLTGNAKRPL